MPVQWLARIVRQRWPFLWAFAGRHRNPSERAMYLVEIEAGREQVYHSVEALAAAIHGGVIGPDSRIFHRASSSWISITLHPEYRKAMAARAAQPLPPLKRSQWTFFGTEAPGRAIDETLGATKGQPEAAEPDPKPRGLRGLFSRKRRAQAAPSETKQASS